MSLIILGLLWRRKYNQHHIRYFGRFPISQFNDSLGRVDVNCTH